MTIIKMEKITLSQKEYDALELAMKICSGLQREASDPFLKASATRALSDFDTIYRYVEEVAD